MSNLTEYQGVQIVSPDPADEGGQALNSNFKALSTHIDTVDPTSSDDSTQGYSYGSRWYNSTTSEDSNFSISDLSHLAFFLFRTSGVRYDPGR